MHCDSLEATGVNAQLTKFHRKTGPLVVRDTDLDPIFEMLGRLGVPVDQNRKRLIVSAVTQQSSQVADRVHKTLQTSTVIRQQQATHYAMIIAQMKARHDRNVNTVSYRSPNVAPHLVPASYHIPRLIHPFMQSDDDTYTLYIDAWALGDDDEPFQSGSEDTGETGGYGGYGGYDGGGSGSAPAPGGDPAGGLLGWASWGLSPTFTTSSGQTLQWCTIYTTLLSLVSGGLAAVSAYLAGLGTTGSLLVGGVTLNPAAIAAILGVLAAYWAACAVLC